MTLRYVGPKPIISETGIEFDNNKEDKYVYLNIVLQLLKAMDHEYIEDKKYTYNAQDSFLSDNDLLRELKKYCPNIDSLVDKTSHSVEDEIEHQVQRAHQNCLLNEDEKCVLESNIEIMHDYLIQRSVNKSVYYYAVESLAEMLKRGHVEYIVVPMFQKFLHVLHSVQGSLKKQKFPIDSKIDIYKENGVILIKLQIMSAK